jgi:hypothetical protein
MEGIRTRERTKGHRSCGERGERQRRSAGERERGRERKKSECNGDLGISIGSADPQRAPHANPTSSKAGPELAPVVLCMQMGGCTPLPGIAFSRLVVIVRLGEPPLSWTARNAYRRLLPHAAMLKLVAPPNREGAAGLHVSLNA